jgi:diketogulonate reductase-like aldo/keto reductase
MGTFGSDRYGPADIAEAVKGAIEVGYRLIDCAAVYGNEPEVGESLRAALDSVPREDLFVTTKVWNDAHLPDDAVASVLLTIGIA